jgi:hypothetical protein
MIESFIHCGYFWFFSGCLGYFLLFENPKIKVNLPYGKEVFFVASLLLGPIAVLTAIKCMIERGEIG